MHNLEFYLAPKSRRTSSTFQLLTIGGGFGSFRVSYSLFAIRVYLFMNIVCTFDDNYLPHCAAMLTTLRNANPHHYFHVSLVHSGENMAEACKLYTYIASIMDLVSLIQLNSSIFAHLPLSNYLTAAAYARLALPDILPAGLTRVLYLDPDIAVVGDLKTLYDLDLKGCPLAAVPDYYEPQETQRLCLERSMGYFNSGVLLIDLPSWRKVNLSDYAFAMTRDFPERISYADQDILNSLFQGNWLRLDQCWNYQTMAALDDHYYKPKPLNEINPSIIHFVGPAHSKPWHINCVNPYSRVFRDAKRLTPWAKAPLTGGPPSLTIKIKSFIKNTLLG